MASPAPTVVTDGLELTPLTVEDAEAMMGVVADERMYEFTGGAPPTLEQLRDRYRRMVVGASPDGSERWCNWIVRRTGAPEPVGVVQATINAEGATADIAWEVGVPWQGQGIASAATIAVLDWLAGEGVRTVRACIHPDHHASAGVAIRAGLAATDEAVDGETVWRRSLG